VFLRFIKGERKKRRRSFPDEGAPRKKKIAGRIVVNCTLGHYETANAERFVTWRAFLREKKRKLREEGRRPRDPCGPPCRVSPSSRFPVPTPFVSQSR